MTMGFIRDHRKILLLEMEPSLLADLLLEKFLLDIKEHDEVEGICNRKRKCQVLLSFLEKHKDEVEKFGYELQRSKCFPAMVEMKDAFPDIPGTCSFNIRKSENERFLLSLQIYFSVDR